MPAPNGISNASKVSPWYSESSPRNAIGTSIWPSSESRWTRQLWYSMTVCSSAVIASPICRTSFSSFRRWARLWSMPSCARDRSSSASGRPGGAPPFDSTFRIGTPNCPPGRGIGRPGELGEPTDLRIRVEGGPRVPLAHVGGDEPEAAAREGPRHGPALLPGGTGLVEDLVRLHPELELLPVQ